MSRGSQTNAPILASSELLETLQGRAYVRGGGDPFLITELALLATDLVAAFQPSHAAIGSEPITAPFGTYQRITEQVIMSRTLAPSDRCLCRKARANPNGSRLESTVPERELLKP